MKTWEVEGRRRQRRVSDLVCLSFPLPAAQTVHSGIFDLFQRRRNRNSRKEECGHFFNGWAPPTCLRAWLHREFQTILRRG